jgi:hypothetical protein
MAPHLPNLALHHPYEVQALFARRLQQLVVLVGRKTGRRRPDDGVPLQLEPTETKVMRTSRYESSPLIINLRLFYLPQCVAGQSCFKSS